MEAHNWDMTAACNSYFQDDDEQATENQTAPDNYTGPRTLDGRPAPQSASSSARRPAAASQPKRKGIATLGSMGGGSAHHDDDDDDDDDLYDDDERDRGELFAGGEKSGLAVKDPKQEGGPRKIISDILAKAKA